jgi:polyhydroxybutyrate depolymerase
VKSAFAALLLAMSFAFVACGRRDQPKAELAGAAASARPGRGGTPPEAPREIAFGDGTVRFFVPARAEGAAKLPFVLVLHGLGGSGAEIVEALGLAAFASARQFLFVAPDGTLDAQGRRFWNANEVCCNFGGIDVNDVERLSALIEYGTAKLNADPERVFVVGYSNGGFMAHRLACEQATRVRAIVSIAATGPGAGQRCQPKRAVSVLEIHGSDDPIVPFDSGHLFGRAELPPTPSVPAGLAVWARAAGCEGQLRALERFDLIHELPGAETESFGYSGCSGSSPLLWKVAGAGHVIPLGSAALDAIWRFLSEKG